MRKIHNAFQRFHALFLLLGLTVLVLTIESCKDDDDDCPTIECNTGVQSTMTCDCDCPEGFSGVNCETEDRPLKIRKDAKDMTTEEINDFVNAVLTLKATPSPYTDTLSYYDTFVRFHQMAVQETKCSGFGVAHANPAFPPWHRKMLILFEDALSEVSGKDISLPYWDWTDQASTDAVFSSALMGGDGDPNDEYALNDGPFRKDNWQVNLFTNSANYIGLNPYRWIVRKFGAAIPSSPGYRNYPGYPVVLPTINQVDNCLSITTYDMAPWDCSDSTMLNTSFRFCLEGFLDGNCNGGQAIHNIGHDYVAGFFTVDVPSIERLPVEAYNPSCDSIYRDTVPNNVRVGSMEPLDVSPNDPAFFLHHCNVDRIWAQWQDMPGNAESYTPESGQADGYNINDNMYPYNIPSFQAVPAMTVHGDTPASMLDYRALGYKYE